MYDWAKLSQEYGLDIVDITTENRRGIVFDISEERITIMPKSENTRLSVDVLASDRAKRELLHIPIDRLEITKGEVLCHKNQTIITKISLGRIKKILLFDFHLEIEVENYLQRKNEELKKRRGYTERRFDGTRLH